MGNCKNNIDITIESSLEEIFQKEFGVLYYHEWYLHEVCKRIQYIISNKEKFRDTENTKGIWNRPKTIIDKYLYAIFKDYSFTDIRKETVDELEYWLISILGNTSKAGLNNIEHYIHNIDYIASINNDKETILSRKVEHISHYSNIDYDILRYLLEHKPMNYLIELLTSLKYYYDSKLNFSYNTIKVMKEYLNNADKIYKYKDYMELTCKADEENEWIYKYLFERLTQHTTHSISINYLINKIDRETENCAVKNNINLLDIMYRRELGMNESEIIELGLIEKIEYNLTNITNRYEEGKLFIETMIRKKMYGEW